MVKKRTAVLDQIGQESFNRNSSQLKCFVEVVYDPPAQHQEAICALLDGSRHQIRRSQGYDKVSGPGRKSHETGTL